MLYICIYLVLLQTPDVNTESVNVCIAKTLLLLPDDHPQRKNASSYLKNAFEKKSPVGAYLLWYQHTVENIVSFGLLLLQLNFTFIITL